MSRKNIIEDIVEYPKFENERFFVKASIGTDNDREAKAFYEDFIEFIREMGIVYRRNILGEYLVILNKTKDPQEAQKEFERKITSP